MNVAEKIIQLANLCNIKVKEELELIMLDIEVTVTYVKNFINKPIKIMAQLIKN
jgi:hypothetical protein